MRTLNVWAEAWLTGMGGLSLQVAMLVTLVGAVCVLGGRLAPQVRALLWLAVLLRLCVPIGIHAPFGFGGAVESFIIRLSQEPSPGPPSFSGPVSPKVLFSIRAESVQELPPLPPVRPNVAAWLFMLWLGGAVLFGGLVFWRYAAIMRRLRPLGEAERKEVRALFERLAGEMGLKLDPRRLRLAGPEFSIALPAVVGVFRPVVLLPATMAETWAPAQLEPILIHELAHIRRRDPLINLLQIIAQVAYWFHPWVWFANAALRRERELACDDEVARRSGERYTEGLIRLVQARSSFVPLGWVGLGMMERRSFLFRRIKRLASEQYTCPRPAGRPVKLMIAGFVLLCIALTSDHAATEKPETSQDPAMVDDSWVKLAYMVRESKVKAARNKLFELSVSVHVVPALTGPADTIEANTLIVEAPRQKHQRVLELLKDKGYVARGFDEPLAVETFRLFDGPIGRGGIDRAQVYSARIVQGIKTLLYADMGQYTAAKVGRRTIYDHGQFDATVIDTFSNLERVRKYLDSLPESGGKQETDARPEEPTPPADPGLIEKNYRIRKEDGASIYTLLEPFFPDGGPESPDVDTERVVLVDGEKLVIRDTPENLRRTETLLVVESYISIPLPEPDATVLKVLHLKTQSPVALLPRLKKKFPQSDVNIEADDKLNTLVIRGPQALISKIEEFARACDQPAQPQIAIIPVFVLIESSEPVAELERIDRLDKLDEVAGTKGWSLTHGPRVLTIEGETAALRIERTSSGPFLPATGDGSSPITPLWGDTSPWSSPVDLEFTSVPIILSDGRIQLDSILRLTLHKQEMRSAAKKLQLEPGAAGLFATVPTDGGRSFNLVLGVSVVGPDEVPE